VIGPMPWYAWLWCVAMVVILGSTFWVIYDTNRILKRMKRYR
jgi:hypothetical protein